MSPLTVQWTVLVMCVFGTAIRVPGVRRGEGRAIFVALVLVTVAVALSLPPIYHAVDALLGGVNVANLLLRFLLYAVFLLLGMRVAAAFHSATARRLIVGPVGIVALTLTVAATLYFFIASELPTSSPGLVTYQSQDTVQEYGTVGRLYPGYVSACLLIPSLASVLDSHARRAHRVAAAFLAGGFLLVVVYVVLSLTMLELGPWDVFLPFTAILLTLVGLCLIRFSHTAGVRKRRRTNKLE